MKDPVIAIKKGIYALLGDSFSANSETVQVYTDPPQKPPNNFVWGQPVTFGDFGSKDTFIDEVFYEIVCVSKQSVAHGTTITLDAISDYVLDAVVVRGTGMTDPDGDFNIYSVMLTETRDEKAILKDKMEYSRRLRLRFSAEQL